MSIFEIPQKRNMSLFEISTKRKLLLKIIASHEASIVEKNWTEFVNRTDITVLDSGTLVMTPAGNNNHRTNYAITIKYSENDTTEKA